MDDSLHFSLAPGARLGKPSPGRLALLGARVEIPLDDRSPAVVGLIRKLAAGRVSEAELVRASAAAGSAAAAELSYCLLLLAEEGLLCRTLVAAGAPMLTSVPLAAGDDAERRPFQPRASYTLSRFAYCRRDGGRFVLECPLSRAQILLHDWRGVALVAALARPRRLAGLRKAVPGLSASGARLAAELLWEADALARVEGSDGTVENGRATLAPWEFHDLLFHSRSRQGRHSAGYGQTNRLTRLVKPLPAVKPAMSREVVHLAKPEIAAVEAADWPLTRALEQRHSERRHGERPITLRQLGEFLYRSARARKAVVRQGEEFTERVYPGAGSAYELEFYLVVHRSADLAAGMYHYQPLEHRLYRLAAKPEETERLLESAARTAGSAKPQVLIVAAARFARIMRRYESIGYALILKNVGAVFQTMYLVATAMGLAACALGGGDSDVFARAAGTDYYAETSVGEFMLGSVPASD
ncbi:MAG TPA: SagB family peptide dehydrogenase [Candidatus Acidoferrales bacterium]|nr:SagB family peptide dehydrogenase [Candidatus Acidoferrales bacterium]